MILELPYEEEKQKEEEESKETYLFPPIDLL